MSVTKQTPSKKTLLEYMVMILAEETKMPDDLCLRYAKKILDMLIDEGFEVKNF